MQENLEIRPKNFDEFIGQDELKETLKALISSADKRKKYLDHILFYGPPGLGKTTLAKIIALENQKVIKYVQGPLLEKKSDILSLFSTIQKGNIIFIDEIHSINKNIEELLYSALEDFVIDISIGADGESRIMRMKLPEFTLIGATTRFDRISQPLRDRFGYVAKLKEYKDEEIKSIIKNSSKKLNIFLDDKCIDFIINYSNKTPRIVNNLLKRIRDFYIHINSKEITIELIKKTFNNIGMYLNGLNNLHIEYLNLLGNVFKNRTVALNVIVAILKENRDNILENVEPELLKQNFIEKGSKGRKITPEGVEYLRSL